MALQRPTLEDIVSLCKRRGFVFPTAEIYGGLNGVYDCGPLGSLLKNNLRNLWTQSISVDKTVLFLEGALLGPQAVWEASGHIASFHDPMIDCTNCKKRFRADDPDIDITGPCPNCGKNAWTTVREFNMMFKTDIGAVAGQAIAYLRPETAQSIFINFKNIISSYRVKIPFGIAQIGKSFRNEITPKQFLFRMREFEQMEIEWFCIAQDSSHFFTMWCNERINFYTKIGLTSSRIRLRSHEKSELSHYSRQTSDVEYEYPFGWKELEGIADRGDYDLRQHSTHSGKDLSVFDEETHQSYLPNVVECSVGTDRLFLTVLFDAYTIDTLGGEERIVLKLHPAVAPIKAAFLPLTKKLTEPMERIFKDIIRLGYAIEFDESGSIGKRYRRHDEIGTPVCFTYDFDSINDNCVTARDRDTLKQERISIEKIANYLYDMVKI